jgi:hypothetical protein
MNIPVAISKVSGNVRFGRRSESSAAEREKAAHFEARHEEHNKRKDEIELYFEAQLQSGRTSEVWHLGKGQKRKLGEMRHAMRRVVPSVVGAQGARMFDAGRRQRPNRGKNR